MAAVHEAVFLLTWLQKRHSYEHHRIGNDNEHHRDCCGDLLGGACGSGAHATRMSTLALTSSAASALKRSYCSAAKRFSRTKFLLST